MRLASSDGAALLIADLSLLSDTNTRTSVSRRRRRTEARTKSSALTAATRHRAATPLWPCRPLTVHCTMCHELQYGWLTEHHLSYKQHEIYLLYKHNQLIDLDVSISIRDFRQKKLVQLFKHSMNRDEGSYSLSHTYDRFLVTLHHYHGKNRKNWTSFFWRRSLIEIETSR